MRDLSFFNNRLRIRQMHEIEDHFIGNGAFFTSVTGFFVPVKDKFNPRRIVKFGFIFKKFEDVVRENERNVNSKIIAYETDYVLELLLFRVKVFITYWVRRKEVQ